MKKGASRTSVGGRDGSALLQPNEIKLSDQPGPSMPINEAELSAAFDFFDISGQGRITPNDLKQRLGAFYKNLPPKDIKMLLGDGPFTKETLRNLLSHNELGNYDPVKEAFKAYDPNGTGFADPETLRSIFQALGYGEITDEDLQVLVETADADRDGKISLEDFRQMMRFSERTQNAQPLSAPPAAAGASS